MVVAERLSRILLLGAEEKRGFVVHNISLVKLCFIEHTINMLISSMPCERQTLLKCNQSMLLFETLGISMCDSFRQDTVVTGEETWEDMNSVAGVRIDRCMRMCKLKMSKIPDPIIKMSMTPSEFRAPCMGMQSTGGDMLVLRSLFPSASQEDVSFCSKMQSCVSCHPLPLQVQALQRESLWELHSSCYKRIYSAHHLTFCLLCSINERGVRCKARMCCTTGEMRCDSCPPGTIISVNMLGVFLKICNTSYYMCPCCTKIQVWR